MPQPRRWIDELLEVYDDLGGVAHYKEVYTKVMSRNNMDLNANSNWKAAVRRTVEQHSSDSDAWLGKEDLFYSVAGKGKGIWGIRKVLTPVDEKSLKELTRGMNEVDLENFLQSTDEEIEKFLSKLNGDGRIEERNALVRIRKASQKTIRELKKLYDHTCQICGESHKTQYGVNVVEAHHIEYFSTSQNHQPQNILILCPTHHRLVHAGKAVFDRSIPKYRFNNGFEEIVKLNRHIKNHSNDII